MKPIIIYWNSKCYIPCLRFILTVDVLPDKDTDKHKTDAVPDQATVFIILEELGLPYNSSFTTIHEMKDDYFYEHLSPKGGLPGV